MSAHQRRALVTGGSRGIGQAIAAALRERGMEILTPSRGEMDLLEGASLRRFLARPEAQEIDVLVNNAGINTIHPIEEIPAAEWEKMIRTNLTAPLEIIQQIVPGMKTRRWGRIVNISSILGLVTRPGRAAYSTLKSGLNGLTRTCAVEFGPFGVLVNSVCPGYVETDLTRQNNSPSQLDEIAQAIPLRRLAQPPEIAQLVAFLCSEENTYLTGQSVIVDGGFTCQ